MKEGRRQRYARDKGKEEIGMKSVIEEIISLLI
jgi:hypothetical protein